jgi:O-antigen/teichoic acid export membrane protein
VTYLRDLSLYFATPAFASPVLLSILGGPEPVALFATSYFIAASTVTLVVSGFRGIYRPAFARVLVSGDRAQLQRAFDLINKMQVLAVVPAGFGLAVMVADYLLLARMATRSLPRCRSHASWW